MKIPTAVAVSLAVSLSFASAATASPTSFPFQADNLYLAGSATCAPLVRDFNGDRWADIATGGSNHWDLLLGGGKVRLPSGVVDKGQFAATPSHPSNGCPVAAVDFNRDGRLDVATRGASSGVQIWLGHGDGTFATPVSFDTGSRRLEAVGDLNGDGRPDLVLAGYAAHDYNVGIRYGNALGFSSEQRVAVAMPAGDPSSPTYVDHAGVADLNGDRRPDLIVGGFDELGENPVVTLLNRGRLGNGQEAFTQTAYRGTGNNSDGFVAKDFNEDGIADLVITASGLQSPGDIRLGLGDGSGGFGALTDIGGHSGGVRHPAIADFDRDGHRDIAFGTASTQPFSVRFGLGNGSFGPELYGNRGPATASLARINANHDGHPDVVAVDTRLPGVIVYFNTLGRP
jgi:VCBS repeat protein